MTLHTRTILNQACTILGYLSIAFMVAVLFIILGPIFVKGAGAYLFRATIEHRRVEHQVFGRGDESALQAEEVRLREYKEHLVHRLESFKEELREMESARARVLRNEVKAMDGPLRALFGPLPGDSEPVMMRGNYGETRWDRALVQLESIHFRTEWDYSDPSRAGVMVKSPRHKLFAGTGLESIFTGELSEEKVAAVLQPRMTLYWRFVTDESYDAHFFGGIWPELLGTIYLTIGAMLFALPMGILAAIYLAEYASDNFLIGFIRSCISTLAGVPSIVFGLFGLAFFINAIGISPSKSVLAGSLTLALLILPTIIRSAEEAIKAVPRTYKEAAMGLGASRWRTIVSVIIPAALPGILTGVVISMGRAAGETAPIIFTAAVSMGTVPGLTELAREATPALPWNIYNLCSEHEAVDQIRHVQFGMVAALVGLILVLNAGAIVLRARVARKLRA